jgi:hypothetical protein
MKVKCKNCSVEFNKAPSAIKTSPNHFCSRSCAAQLNNKLTPKRKKINIPTPCACGQRKKKMSAMCKKCVSTNLLLKTKSDFAYNNKANAASRWCRLREHARNIAEENGLYQKGCAKCGYSKHVEICHIKPLAEFPDTATIGEINNISNLIQLCPNCHWELDHS